MVAKEELENIYIESRLECPTKLAAPDSGKIVDGWKRLYLSMKVR